jgi:hypothetical protein
MTSSLFVSNLDEPGETWAFLIDQGLVRDHPGDRGRFVGLLDREVARGEITGPSVSSRVAGALVAAGLTLPAAEQPDPNGRHAIQCRQQLDGAGKEGS